LYGGESISFRGERTDEAAGGGGKRGGRSYKLLFRGSQGEKAKNTFHGGKWVQLV